jgi:hypothetical protein
VNAVTTTAKAAGLKICFLFIATIYLEAIESTAAQSNKAKLVAGLTGVMIRARISAVIYTDSTFVPTSKTLAKRVFVAQVTAIKKVVDNKRLIGEKGKI